MICVIVASLFEKDLYIPENSFIIAADKGYETLKIHNIRPDMVLGDFDSLGFVPDADNVEISPAEKDDTDMMLAVRTGLSKGFNKFLLYGGIGGRLDHTLANIQTLAFLSENKAKAVLFGEETAVMLLKDEKISFDEECNGYISVFAYGEKSEGVTESGLKYSLSQETLTDTFPIGVSNEFVGEKSEISVENGRLLIVWQTSSKKATDTLLKV